MPNRSTRGMFSSCLLLAAWLSSAEAQEWSIPYEITRVDRFSDGLIHGRNAYEGMSRGDFDPDPLPEVVPFNRPVTLPPVQVVYPSAPPPVQELLVVAQVDIELRGEDRVFDRIRLDEAIQRCVFQRICTDEVRSIPGIYLGDEQDGDAEWQGRRETTDAAPETGSDAQRPGRAFMQVPAEPVPVEQPEAEEPPAQLPESG